MFTDEFHQHIHDRCISQGAGFDGVNRRVFGEAAKLLANQVS